MIFQEFEEGKVYKCKPFSLTKEEIVSYAKQFDRAHLHTNEESAKRTIFGDIIAPGFLVASLAWLQFTDLQIMGYEFLGGTEISELKFISPVYAGDVVTPVVKVLTKTELPKGKSGLITFGVKCTKNDGELVFVSKANMMISCIALEPVPSN